MCRRLVLCTVFVFVLGSAAVVPTNAADPSLQFWLEFEGNVNDSSGNNRHGTINGAPAFIPGVLGQGLGLNGNPDYVAITGYKGVLGTSAFSVAAWIRTTSNGNIVCWGDTVGAGNGHRVEFRLLNGRLRVEHGTGNLQGDTVVNDGQWHHVALTAKENAACDDPDTRFWLDGFDDAGAATLVRARCGGFREISMMSGCTTGNSRQRISEYWPGWSSRFSRNLATAPYSIRQAHCLNGCPAFMPPMLTATKCI